MCDLFLNQCIRNLWSRHDLFYQTADEKAYHCYSLHLVHCNTLQKQQQTFKMCELANLTLSEEINNVD